MHAETKRIGLVLASIHTGAAQNVWPSFVKTALRENKSLYIFPGGRLNARVDSENLRNPIYSLVNSKNLDGCISWSSTIRYRESKEEFEHFHSGFDSLPYVTLTYKIPGHPCVAFDAYTGMKLMTIHCIRVHGAKKIAFIRGPDFNESALARLKGYEDALKETGLPVIPGNPLVTDPFNWDNGDAAAAQLFEKRKLRPGQDFDTLIGSSDLMALAAINYFSKQGYHIPRDYHALGFNNSAESRLTESPLSTVNVPYSALSSESFHILMKLLGKKKSGCEKAIFEDILLPAEPIVRESCGCEIPHSLPYLPIEITGKKVKKKNLRTGKEPEKILNSMIASYLKLSAADTSAFVSPVVRALLCISRPDNPEVLSPASTKSFFNLFEKALVRFFESYQDTELLFGLINDITRSGLISLSLIRNIEPSLYRTIFKVREQLAFHTQYEKEKWNTALNSLKCELLGTRDRNSLILSLARHLPKIGIFTAGIALYEDDKTSLWVGSFSPGGINPVQEQSFPAGLLVPESLRREFSRDIFMVQPLFIENQSLGYFVHTVPVYNGVIFEELRSAVSYALKGIFQLEEMGKTIRIAEQAERAKTEFLRTLENELYAPLSGVMEKIEGLEKFIVPEPVISKEMNSLKTFVASREEQAGNIIDLALSRIGELDLRKTLFDPGELFPGIGSVKTHGAFPLLLGDTSRLSQCFSLIREEYSLDFSAVMTHEGLVLNFRAGSIGAKKKGENRKKQTMLLSERIILMHGGEFKRNTSACTVTLPWPALTREEKPYQHRGRQEHILALSGQHLPAVFADLPVVRDPEQAAGVPGKTAFIVWNTANAGPEELLKISSLRQRNEFRNAAFLCYGEEFIGEESIIDGVEKLLRSPKKKTFLFIGEREHQGIFRKLAGDEICIPSMTVFNETVAEISPQMIIFDSVNTESVAVVRRHPITVTVPIVIICGRIDSAADVAVLSQFSRLIICHRSAASSPEFHSRLQAIVGGDEILAPHTGALVKKTLLYFDQHVQSHISRWKLAEAVNVNEDYLTRIFHRETGLSLWDYLNRLRIFGAADLLLQTDESIQKIAFRSGFQDHAYFCRVFRKIYGIPPGQLRKQQKMSE